LSKENEPKGRSNASMRLRHSYIHVRQKDTQIYLSFGFAHCAKRLNCRHDSHPAQHVSNEHPCSFARSLICLLAK